MYGTLEVNLCEVSSGYVVMPLTERITIFLLVSWLPQPHKRNTFRRMIK